VLQPKLVCVGLGKGKGKAYLTSRRSDMDHKGLLLQTTPYLPLPYERSPLVAPTFARLQMAPPEWQTSNYSSLLIYRPRKDERLSWPSWMTYSGRYTHISGHTSAADRAEARENSPVRDRRSNHWATQPTVRGLQYCTPIFLFLTCLQVFIFQIGGFRTTGLPLATPMNTKL